LRCWASGADALYGKRSKTRHAHDRYANQEIADLLQRGETFAAVVILITNLLANLDGACCPLAQQERMGSEPFTAHICCCCASWSSRSFPP
jgi:adenine/guanine phosphoribosyltransferase-like PRPP-binding protein